MNEFVDYMKHILTIEPAHWTTDDAQLVIAFAFAAYSQVALLIKEQEEDDAVVAVLGSLVLYAAPRVDADRIYDWDRVKESMEVLLYGREQ